jgi:hypothetical protein
MYSILYILSLVSIPNTLYSLSYTLNPKLYTLYSLSYTLNPKPYILYPTFYAMYRRPYTHNPHSRKPQP